MTPSPVAYHDIYYVIAHNDLFVILAMYTAFLVFARKRFLTYLQPLQQDDYNHERFITWVARNLAVDTHLTLALGATLFASLYMPAMHGKAFVALLFGVAFLLERDPRKHGKKKLVLTARAKRILYVAMLLAALVGTWCFLHGALWVWILCVQSLPVLLAFANMLLAPYETATQKKFWAEAHEKITTLKPVVIGITGSFGKTSVKHILGHVLNAQARTLVTPGSVNTPMGIARIVREQLDETYKYFIVEMGAYQSGSIAKICALTPPDTGIITAIGAAHYERFKTLETVAETKFALAQSVLANRRGKVIAAQDTLRFTHTQALHDTNRAQFIVCGAGESCELRVLSVEQEQHGLTVAITWQNKDYTLHVPLFGTHHGHNAAMAFAAAASLGMTPEDIIAALRSVPQITHRLEVKPQPDGRIFIDDAFNSNPAGFRAALDLLPVLGAGRKILVTPGMVELGAAHDEEHRAIARHAACICDIVLAVQPRRIRAFVDTFCEAAPAKTLLEFDSFAAAAAWLDANRQSSDIVLIENDLPDLYERRPRI